MTSGAWVASLTLLGRFRLHVPGQPEIRLPRKTEALLAFVALSPGRAAGRDHLADLLWGGNGAQQARHSLRQALAVLRKQVNTPGSSLLQSRADRLCLSDAVAVDILQVRAIDDTSTPDALEQAARLCTGAALADFPSSSPEFDDWLAQTRSETAEDVMRVLNRLADAQTASSNLAAAIVTLKRMLALDPLRESNIRRLMTTYTAAGRQSDAIRLYNDTVDLLRRHLDIIPSPETDALYRTLRAGSPASTSPQPQMIAPPAQARTGPPWIAVLPFRGESEAVPAHLALGIADEIIGALAMLREPVIVSANAPYYLQAQTTTRQLGRELGVQYVVSGRFRRDASGLRLACQLQDTESAVVLWAGTYNVDDIALFDAQDAIVARIVAAVAPRVTEAELRRIRGKRPEFITAYDLTLQARQLIGSLEQPAFMTAASLLKRSIELDPCYAAAHALTADWYSHRIAQGWSPDPAADAEALDRASTTALAHDGAHARAMAFLGHNRTILNRDYDSALDLFDRATDTAPHAAAPWLWSSPTYAYLGDGAEAVRRAERALRHAPQDAFNFQTHHFLSIAYFTLGEFEQAAHWGKMSAKSNPRYPSNLRITAAALAATRKQADARQFAAMVMQLQPRFRVRDLVARHPYREPRRRDRYGELLLQAQLPA